MASKYAAQYIERAKRDVKNFEQACRVLRFDPEKESDFDAIVTAVCGYRAVRHDSLGSSFPVCDRRRAIFNGCRRGAAFLLDDA